MRMSIFLLVLGASAGFAGVTPDAACAALNKTVLDQAGNGQLHRAEVALAEALSDHSMPQSCEWLILQDMAGVMSRVGRPDEAERYAERAVRILEESGAPDDPALLRPLHSLAAARLQLGNVAGARESFQRMQKIRLEQPIDRALFDGTAATVVQAEGSREEAEAEYIRCLAASRESGLGESADSAAILNGLADLYITGGRFDEAANALQRALAIFAVAKDAGPAAQLRALNSQGVLRGKRGQWMQAEDSFRAALQVADGAPGLNPAMLGPVLGNYARALRENHHGRDASAVEGRLNALNASLAKRSVVSVAELGKR